MLPLLDWWKNLKEKFTRTNAPQKDSLGFARSLARIHIGSRSPLARCVLCVTAALTFAGHTLARTTFCARVPQPTKVSAQRRRSSQCVLSFPTLFLTLPLAQCNCVLPDHFSLCFVIRQSRQSIGLRTRAATMRECSLLSIHYYAHSIGVFVH